MTATATTQPALDDLLDHAGWLRRLATGLVHDSGEAEDLAQEVFLVAARERPANLRHPRAWLAAVARKLALTRSRSDARRSHRERTRPAPDPGQSTDDLVAEAELGRAVAQLVLGLDDPYRTVLLMRYWRDLPPRRIAAQLHRPVETVKVQLRRGLEHLRARLDEQHGRRTTWAGLLVPLASPRSSAALAPSVAAWLGVGALVAAVWFGGNALRAGAFGSAPVAQAITPPARPELAPVSLAAAGLEPPADLRQERQSEDAEPALPATSEELAATETAEDEIAPPPVPGAPWRGRLRGLNGRSLDGVELRSSRADSVLTALAALGYFEDQDQAAAARPTTTTATITTTTTDRQGVFELPVREPGEVRSATDDLHIIGWAHSARPVDGEQFDVFAAETLVLAIEVHDERGKPRAHLELAFTDTCPREVSRRLPSGFGLQCTQRVVTTDQHGLARVVLPRIPVLLELAGRPRQSFEVEECSLPRGRVSRTKSGRAELTSPALLDLTRVRRESRISLLVPHEQPGDAHQLWGSVVHANGTPAVGAQVLLAGVATTTDSEGQFEFEVEAVAAQDALAIFEAGQSPLFIELYGAEIEHMEDPAFAGVFTLPVTQLTLGGVLLDEAGDPLAYRRYWLHDPTHVQSLSDSLEAHAADTANAWSYTGPDGRFELRGLRPRDYRIGVQLSDDRAHTFGPFPAGSSDLRLVP